MYMYIHTYIVRSNVVSVVHCIHIDWGQFVRCVDDVLYIGLSEELDARTKVANAKKKAKQGRKGAGAGGAGAGGSEGGESELFFCKFEEECYHARSLLSFTFPCETQHAQPRTRMVMVISAKEIPAVLTAMAGML